MRQRKEKEQRILKIKANEQKEKDEKKKAKDEKKNAKHMENLAKSKATMEAFGRGGETPSVQRDILGPWSQKKPTEEPKVDLISDSQRKCAKIVGICANGWEVNPRGECVCK